MVEWKNIGEICYISDYVSNGSFASLRENVQYKNEPDYAILVRVADYSCGFDASKFVYIDEHAYNFLAKSSLDGGEIIMSNVGSCGLLFRCPKLDRKMSLAPNAILIKSDYIDFLYYWLGSNTGQEEIKKITSKSAMPKFNKTEFKKINIPIPSLEEQTRIVGILDTFTSAIDNLKEQIAQRRKQYEYYRDQLLDLEGKPGVEMKFITDVAKSFTGLTYKPENVSDSGTLVLRSSNINDDVLSFDDNVFVQMEIPERARVQENDILICVRNGSKRLVGKAAMITKEAEGMAFGAFMTILRSFAINSKFLFYVWQSEKVRRQYKGDEAMPIAQITAKDFQRIVIPVPPLSEQQRIVSILDTFEASIQNLEAQLKEREKQYEYYRNKLLTFE